MTLGKVGGDSAVPQVAALLLHKDEAVREAASATLSRIVDGEWGSDVPSALAWWERHKDASRGRKPIWLLAQKELPGPVDGMARTGDSLVAWGESGSETWLGCFEITTGKKLWERGMGSFPGCVTGVSLHGEGVVLLGNGKQGGWLSVVDPACGKTKWERVLGGGSLPPNLQMAEDGFLVWREEKLSLLNPSTGEVRESWDTGHSPCGSLASWGPFTKGPWGRLVLGGTTPESETWLARRDLNTGKFLWETRLKMGPRPRILVVENEILAGGGEADEEGWLAKIEMKDGNVVWQKGLEDLPGEGIAEVLLDSKWVIAGGASDQHGGWLGRFNPGNGSVVWQKKPKELPGCVRSLRLLKEGIFVGGVREEGEETQEWVGLYDLETGKALWEIRSRESRADRGIPLEADWAEGTLAIGGRLETAGKSSRGEGWLRIYRTSPGKPPSRVDCANAPGELRAIRVFPEGVAAGGGGRAGWLGLFRSSEER